MMHTIISKYEYEDLLKKYIKKNLYVVMYLMGGIGLLQLVIMLMVSGFDEDVFTATEELIMFIIPAVFFVVTLIIYRVIRRVDQRDVVHYSFPIYDTYDEAGTKVPLYRLVQNGKNSETIYIMLVLNGSSIKLYDLKRKGMVSYKESTKQQTIFKFFTKTKNDDVIIREKIDMIINGKKHRIYGFKDVNKKLLSFCQTEDYQVEILNK